MGSCLLNASDFFFSSRRRHTISYGDWSSDVCSSDLGLLVRDVDARDDGGLAVRELVHAERAVHMTVLRAECAVLRRRRLAGEGDLLRPVGHHPDVAVAVAGRRSTVAGVARDAQSADPTRIVCVEHPDGDARLDVLALGVPRLRVEASIHHSELKVDLVGTPFAVGAHADGKWGSDKVNFQLTVVNGRFYSKPGNTEGKDIQARVSVRVLDTDDSSRVGGLRITGYAGYGRAPTGDRNRYIGMVSYRSKQITLAGEAAATQDGQLGATNGHVYSAFGVYKFPQTKAAVIARVDVTHKQSGAVDKQTRFIGGVSYQLTPNWRLLGDWDYANYQTDALNTANYATRSQALFQTQFTF